MGTQHPGQTELFQPLGNARWLCGLVSSPGHHLALASSSAHLGRAARGGGGGAAPPARRSSSRPPACCSGPETHLQTASAGSSPTAEKETKRERRLSANGDTEASKTSSRGRSGREGSRLLASWCSQLWCCGFLPLSPQTSDLKWSTSSPPFRGNQYGSLLELNTISRLFPGSNGFRC